MYAPLDAIESLTGRDEHPRLEVSDESVKEAVTAAIKNTDSLGNALRLRLQYSSLVRLIPDWDKASRFAEQFRYNGIMCLTSGSTNICQSTIL